MTDPTRHLHRHDGTVSRRDREVLLGQRGTVVWFTGLSGAGKSTLARALEARLAQAGRLVQVLDGDAIRMGLCSDLGFAAADRTENIRRIGHVAALLADTGVIVLTAFVSPFRADRAKVRALLGADFVEVFVDAPIATCEQRDPKGLWKQARGGAIREFTGIDSPYEPPEHPELHLRTDRRSVGELVDTLHEFLDVRGRLSPPPEAGS